MSFFTWLRKLLLGMSAGLAACQPMPDQPLRVSIIGDVLLARGVPAVLARDSTALAQGTRRWWAGSRYIIGNLECPLTTHEQPAAKQFVFRAEPRWAAWLRRLGLTHVSLANNHTFDRHLTGLRDTDQAARAARLGTLGYQADSAAGCLPQLLGPDSSVAVLAYSTFRVGGAGEGCVCERCRGVARTTTSALLPGLTSVIRRPVRFTPIFPLPAKYVLLPSGCPLPQCHQPHYPLTFADLPLPPLCRAKSPKPLKTYPSTPSRTS